MASAQVLPSSRKQEHLEAGKRRLEEFRKKKAAERAKKVASISQPHALDVSLDQKQPLGTEHVQLTDSDGVGTSDGPGRNVEPTGVSMNNGNSFDNTEKVEKSSSQNADPNIPSSDYSTLLSGITQKHTNNHDSYRHNASGFAGSPNVKYGQDTEKMNNDSGLYSRSKEESPYGTSSDHYIASSFHERSSESSLNGRELFQSKEDNTSLKDSVVINDGTHFPTSLPSSTSFEQHTFKPGYGSTLATAVSQTSESTDFKSDAKISPNHVPQYLVSSESNNRRSHPSFLDSLNISRSSSQSSFQHSEPEKSFIINTSKSNGIDALGSSAFQKLPVETETARHFSESTPSSFDHATQFSFFPTNGVINANENSMERNHEFYLPKQNGDFSALEQHIEDLTQEKFSLQRALEASRALAESLAAENSSLTDSYNQQRGVVNQLKSDMEQLQEEIKAHLVELESAKIACANAQLECNAADERAKLLASEVIGLEEKALRLRSSELKLERQLESSHTEITSYKKKMSSLEKDRQDLQLTIDALQEEKKLLQSKLRKASVTEKSAGVSRSAEKKNVATSTEDLGDIPETSGQETHDAASFPGSDASDLLNLPDNGQLNLEASSVYIPPDQMRMIQNINTTISELALEKEELMQALTTESSQRSKLQDLNNDLSRKLEIQTQRLELLTAQSMANENIPARLPPDSHAVQDSSAYADEGDEVVERVLGWIMKLFPGGPSRRRTSKLL
ncbi:PROTEIN BLISTER [Salix purpurea]|uniref:PROTEIN BLISTER n=1 Tax=Salix purpurea TaxID=77065 RepID=A0A9Q0U9B8_SALPP|nr:PROTEIN BLISTER [Salix purpurea]